MKKLRTRDLEIGYLETGDPAGFPVILLHGFPDDAHAYDECAEYLAAAGYRTLAPFLRGYGPTRFLDAAAPRIGQQAAIAQDLLDFMDGLKIDRAALVGYDWGGRAACNVAAIHPERVRCLVSVCGYNMMNPYAPPTPVDPLRQASAPTGAPRAGRWRATRRHTAAAPRWRSSGRRKSHV